MKRKTRQEKAITLIALIITIVVLLILAVVAINSITNTDLIAHAENSTGRYNNSVTNEQTILGGYDTFLNRYNGGSGSGNGEQGGEGSGGDQSQYETSTTVANAKTSGKPYQNNTTITDDYGNKVKVPAGFKIASDSATAVTGGVVIEDAIYTTTIGSQFVWIPVGKIYTDNTAQKETTAKTITLGRYSSFTATNGVYTPAQPTEANPYTSNVAIKSGINNYKEYQSGSTTQTNAIARNINDFYESVMGIEGKEGNGGYYIGRYEAGDSSRTTVASRTGTSGASTEGTLVCKANQVPYNWIKQSDASSKCQSMYANGYKNDGTGKFSSDLVNSYAWDTAIIFIQTFGNATYERTKGKSSIDTTAPQLTGTNRLSEVTNNPIDKQLNIYDMAGNCVEWTTETGSDAPVACVHRGGSYSASIYYTSCRTYPGTTTSSGTSIAFRPLLYVGL